VKKKIEGFHLDGEGHWVADLSCGHKQHMRHQPPWMDRPWVLTPEGRQTLLGVELDCQRCDEIQATVAEATRAACLQAMTRAYEEGGLSGLCAEGRWELAVDAVKSLNLTEALAAKPEARSPAPQL
jgi:hypothetical protein